MRQEQDDILLPEVQQLVSVPDVLQMLLKEEGKLHMELSQYV